MAGIAVSASHWFFFLFELHNNLRKNDYSVEELED